MTDTLTGNKSLEITMGSFAKSTQEDMLKAVPSGWTLRRVYVEKPEPVVGTDTRDEEGGIMTQIPVSEADLASFVEDCLERFNWQWVHIRPARVRRNGRETYETAYAGHKGLPDYCLCVRPPRIVIMEIKSEKGKVSPEQAVWIDLLEQCQKTIFLDALHIRGNKVKGELQDGRKILTLPEVYIFYPSDWQKIVETLR